MSTHPVHSLVPKLPVSPSRSPSWRAADVVAPMDDCEVARDEEETTSIHLYV